jgi:hypothetical protein
LTFSHVVLESISGIRVGEVAERAQSETDVFAWVLAIPGAHQIANAHVTPARQTQREPLAASGEALQNESLLTGASPIFPNGRARIVTLPTLDRAGIEPFGKARG